MKIATFNINNVNKRLAHLLAWLREGEPDVVALQELKAADSEFPRAAIEKAGYGIALRGQKTWNGVAILARGAPPVETGRGLAGDPGDRQSRYIEAAFGGLLIGCLYLPNGNPRLGPKFDYKLSWIERFAARAAELARLDAPVVLAGDYNIIPTDADVYAPERWRDDALFAPEARAAYRDILGQGWTDALRHQYPAETVYTFWKYWRGAFERDAGLRIDHLLLNRHATKRLLSAGVDRSVRGWDRASDHAPAWVELSP